MFSHTVDRVKVLRPTRHKTGHFRDVLPKQSLGFVQKKIKTNTTNANIHNKIYYNRKQTQKTKTRSFGRLL